MTFTDYGTLEKLPPKLAKKVVAGVEVTEISGPANGAECEQGEVVQYEFRINQAVYILNFSFSANGYKMGCCAQETAEKCMKGKQQWTAENRSALLEPVLKSLKIRSPRRRG